MVCLAFLRKLLMKCRRGLPKELFETSAVAWDTSRCSPYQAGSEPEPVAS